jgi:hypothetical protein
MFSMTNRPVAPEVALRKFRSIASRTPDRGEPVEASSTTPSILPVAGACDTIVLHASRHNDKKTCGQCDAKKFEPRTTAPPVFWPKSWQNGARLNDAIDWDSAE